MLTDFWWLSPEQIRQYRYIELFHQEPYSDEPHTDRYPLSCPMLKGDRRYPLEFVSQWKVKFEDINVFRSFAVYSSDTSGEETIGPFLLDIDRTVERDGGYVADIDNALKDTRLLVKEYCSNLKDENYRIFFTGHKGFHIEICPRAISIPLNADWYQHFENSRKDINKRFGNSFVDLFHSHVRLHNSINSWMDYSGRIVYFMNFEVSIGELFNLGATDLATKGEKLAHDRLRL